MLIAVAVTSCFLMTSSSAQVPVHRPVPVDCSNGRPTEGRDPSQTLQFCISPGITAPPLVSKQTIPPAATTAAALTLSWPTSGLVMNVMLANQIAGGPSILYCTHYTARSFVEVKLISPDAASVTSHCALVPLSCPHNAKCSRAGRPFGEASESVCMCVHVHRHTHTDTRLFCPALQ